MSNTHSERVLELIQYEVRTNNKSERQFAEKVGITPSTISSLKESKEGFIKSNLILGIKKAYPNLNLEWLLCGEGEMFVDSDAKKITQGNGNVVNVQTDNNGNAVIKQGNGDTNLGSDYTAILEQKDTEIAYLKRETATLRQTIEALQQSLKDKEQIINLLQKK